MSHTKEIRCKEEWDKASLLLFKTLVIPDFRYCVLFCLGLIQCAHLFAHKFFFMALQEQMVCGFHFENNCSEKVAKQKSCVKD
jgi:hypothetical protein